MGSGFRLVHIGVAAALGAATVTAVGLMQAVGASGGGTASVYVPIVPCRLVDTRPLPDNVGSRATPLNATEIVTFAVWGTNGNCTIPTTATGIATNATAVHPTGDSYVTIYPADASRPTASNLNVVANGAPTPNQVTVGLSAAGAIAAYNNAGTLDLVIDIVGYYTAAPSGGIVNNDERYYTKNEIDTTVNQINTTVNGVSASIGDIQAALATINSTLATKQTKPTGDRLATYLAAGFVPEKPHAPGEYDNSFTDGTLGVLAAGCFDQRVDLPDGAVVKSLEGKIFDSSNTTSTTLTLYEGFFGTFFTIPLLSVSTPSVSSGSYDLSTPSSPVATIDNQQAGYYLSWCATGGPSVNADLQGASIGYALP